jgi:hypothetical protein
MIRFIACVLLGAFPAAAAVRSEIRTLRLGPIGVGATPYIYVPFDVPVSATEITVRLDYDHAGGDNAIDFAIFDSTFSGRDDDLTGYRGKNPNREPLISVIGRTSASHGHLPGPLPPGIWRVMFYVYKTRPAGVDVTLRIAMASENSGADNRLVSSAEAPRWLRGDLHTHTLHSDGSWTIASLAAAAQQAGLDFIAVTDHNTAAHHFDIDAMPAGGPLLLKGIEVTTAGGHMNAWGVPPGRMIEHRQIPGGDPSPIQSSVKQAHSMGALISINHPFIDCKACAWEFDKQAENFDGIEVWNGPWGPEDQRSLDWWKALLRSGRRITAIGSSDSHGPQNELGVPTLSVYARLAVPALLDAIRLGRAVITASPKISVRLEASAGGASAGPGDELTVEKNTPVRVAITLDGAQDGSVILYSPDVELESWPVSASSFRRETSIPAPPRFVRIEARDNLGNMIALSNPIWLKVR